MTLGTQTKVRNWVMQTLVAQHLPSLLATLAC